MYHVGIKKGSKVSLALAKRVSASVDGFVEVVVDDINFIVPAGSIAGIVRGNAPTGPEGFAFAELLGLPFAKPDTKPDATPDKVPGLSEPAPQGNA